MLVVLLLLPFLSCLTRKHVRTTAAFTLLCHRVAMWALSYTSSRSVPAVAAATVQVPVLFDKEEVRERLKRLPGGPMQPLTVHLRQEIDRLNIIVRLATTTLQNLRLAIAGTIALSGALIESLDALFMARIPAAWLKNSWEVRMA